jgi:hypothetical protein
MREDINRQVNSAISPLAASFFPIFATCSFDAIVRPDPSRSIRSISNVHHPVSRAHLLLPRTIQCVAVRSKLPVLGNWKTAGDVCCRRVGFTVVSRVSVNMVSPPPLSNTMRALSPYSQIHQFAFLYHCFIFFPFGLSELHTVLSVVRMLL